MGKISTELDFIIAFAFMLSFYGVLILFGLPSQYQFINAFDGIWLSGGMIGVSLACTLATGFTLPIIGAITCATATGIWAIAGIWTYIVVNNDVIKLIIFTPLTLGLIYVISKLIRGGG